MGTAGSQIIQIHPHQQQQEVLMYGHSHDVWAVAFHPAKPRVCVTVCDGSRVYVWDFARRDLARAATVGFTARAVTVSSQGYGPSGSFHIAVGADNGKIKVSHSISEGWCLKALPGGHKLLK